MEDKWKNCEVQGCANYKFAYRLKEMKKAIKLWAKEEMEMKKIVFEL